MPEKKFIFDLTNKHLKEILISWGEPDYRGEQIWQGLYTQLWDSPLQFSNIPNKIRDKLSKNFSFGSLQPSTQISSKDGQTTKTLMKLPDGNAIESILMEYDKRRTLCISTQVGCAMGCNFCATGQMGFSRNLSSGEIIEQVLYYARSLKEKGEKVTNIVYMGMGEPFLNYKATMASINTLNHPEGFNLGARCFTISTVGIIPAIKRFTNEKSQVNLAVSLHAAEDDLRSSMLPINNEYPIDKLIQACKEYIATTGRRITFEWALISGINDTTAQAQKLGELIGGLNCHVNLIPLNPTLGFSGKHTEKSQVKKFKKTLDGYKIPCTVRVRRGIDIQAGCGQLAQNTI